MPFDPLNALSTNTSAYADYRVGATLRAPSGALFTIMGYESEPSRRGGGRMVRKFRIRSQSTFNTATVSSRWLTMRGFKVVSPGATPSPTQEPQPQPQPQAQPTPLGGGVHPQDCKCVRCNIVRARARAGQPAAEPQAQPQAQPQAPAPVPTVTVTVASKYAADPQPDPTPASVNGKTQHPYMSALLRMVKPDARGRRLMVYVYGEAGSGKTTMAEQVAEALALPFHGISLCEKTPQHTLMGYEVAGRVIRTPLREAFENGGVFLFDEMDSCDSNTLVSINSLLANPFAPFPDGMVRKGDGFVGIGSGNTPLTGGDGAYNARRKPDLSSADRFVVMHWPYDPRTLAAVAGCSSHALAHWPAPKPYRFHDDSEPADVRQSRIDEVARYITQVRLAFDAKRESDADIANRFLPGQRSLANACSLVARGFTVTDALELAMWKGLPMMYRERLMGSDIR